LQVLGVGDVSQLKMQSSLPPQVIVHLNPVSAETQRASTPGTAPHVVMSSVPLQMSLPNCFKAKHEDTFNVQMSAVTPSMLVALSALAYGRPSGEQLAGALFCASPFFQKQAKPRILPLTTSCTQSRPGLQCASETQGLHRSAVPAVSVEHVLLMESQTKAPQASALVPVHWTHAPAEQTFLPGM